MAFMKPGIYPGMDRDGYEAIDALNQSTIKIAYEKSLHHAQWELFHPSSPSEALIDGNALHTLILEPTQFDVRYGPMPVNDKGDKLSRRTGEGAAAWKDYDDTHGTKIPIKPAKIEKMRAIKEMVMHHRTAKLLIENAAHREVAAVWDHPLYGFQCKGQIDLVTSLGPWSVIADLKSAADASPAGFERAVCNYGYMIQDHWYTEGLNEIAKADRRFMFIAFEKDPPHAVCVHELSAALKFEGRYRCEKIAERWSRALETSKYPGYPADVQVVEGKRWVMDHLKEFEDGSDEPSLRDLSGVDAS